MKYNVLSPKRMMRISDPRVSKKNCMPRKTTGLILIDSGDLSKINVDGDIYPRKDCWEIYIYQKENIKKIAKEMDAVGYISAD